MKESQVKIANVRQKADKLKVKVKLHYNRAI